MDAVMTETVHTHTDSVYLTYLFYNIKKIKNHY